MLAAHCGPDAAQGPGQDLALLAALVPVPHPALPGAPSALRPVRLELTAENRHGELVARRMELTPGLRAFAWLLRDLRRCGYRGVVLRRIG